MGTKGYSKKRKRKEAGKREIQSRLVRASNTKEGQIKALQDSLDNPIINPFTGEHIPRRYS